MSIKNERQYRSAVATAASSREALPHIRAEADQLPEPARSMQLNAYAGEIERLTSQIAEYEAARDGHEPIEVRDVADLPLALIKARIRRGWTQRQLADALGVHEQQVQRWEEHEYSGARFETIARVAHALEVPVYATA